MSTFEVAQPTEADSDSGSVHSMPLTPAKGFSPSPATSPKIQPATSPKTQPATSPRTQSAMSSESQQCDSAPSSATQPGAGRPTSASSTGSAGSTLGYETYYDKARKVVEAKLPKRFAPEPNEELLEKVRSANPKKSMPLPKPTISDKIFKSKRKPIRPFDRCPVPTKESPTNTISHIEGLNRHERPLFLVVFVGEDEPRWIDVTVLVKLEPKYIWLDYIRGVYLYEHKRRKALDRKLCQHLSEDQVKEILSDDILQPLLEYIILKERSMKKVYNLKYKEKKSSKSDDAEAGREKKND
jgi:hypothetical protein